MSAFEHAYTRKSIKEDMVWSKQNNNPKEVIVNSLSHLFRK